MIPKNSSFRSPSYLIIIKLKIVYIFWAYNYNICCKLYATALGTVPFHYDKYLLFYITKM